MLKRRPEARISSHGPHSDDTCELSIKWAYMMLLDLGGHRNFIQRHGFNEDSVAAELGLQDLIDEDDFDTGMALRRLRKERKAFDQAYPVVSYPDRLVRNLKALASLIGLDDIDQRLLGFCVMLHSDPILSDAADLLGALGFNRMLKSLSVLLDVPQKRLQPYLSKDGSLMRSGLVEISVENGIHATLSHRLAISSPEFLGALRFSTGTATELFKHAFRPAPPAELQENDFPHVGTSLAVATRYLTKALLSRRSGVNILLYGPPGTGKTQLSRLLAEAMGATLYEVACSDSDGDPIMPRQRLSALRSAMCVLRSQRAMVVLDEIEDIFEAQPIPFAKSNKSQKGWINRALEENPVPCFWLSNSIDALDNAYIRRFDLVVELPNPPRAQRERIIRKVSAGKLSSAMVENLAAHQDMTPAVVARALRIGQTLHPRSGRALEETVRLLADATLKAQGFRRLDSIESNPLPQLYSTGLINTDIDLDELVKGLGSNAAARLCFYGPPGTGKSAFGLWLARQLDRPLMVQRVSDLVTPYVGETEKNLAQAFATADAEQAVLLFDEVDSFLQDRKKARQSWEITAVNEMLTQMESYRGLFIASTNLMHDLDEASMRRFDLKVHFGYLKPRQIETLFASHLDLQKLKDPDGSALRMLLAANNLTAGDFALVARRSRFKPFSRANELAKALLAECRLKSSPSRPIGFVH